MSHTDSESKTKADVYRDRNLLAVAFVAFYAIAERERHGAYTRFGWWPDTDDVNGEEWAVVWTWTPEGQVGWHVPVGMVPRWLPKRDPEYDVYTTEQKNERMRALVDDF